jgi:hypothetical protein
LSGHGGWGAFGASTSAVLAAAGDVQDDASGDAANVNAAALIGWNPESPAVGQRQTVSGGHA